MATNKRERQRANRDAKRVLERKQQQRSALFRKIRRIAIWLIIGITLIVIINLIIASPTDNAFGSSPTL